MWDLPRPGLEPVFPALAGGFLTTEPPGRPSATVLIRDYFSFFLPKCVPRKSENEEEVNRAKRQKVKTGTGRIIAVICIR